MAYFWIISAAFAAEAEGQQEGENVFRSVLTTDGRHACAYTAALEFPHLFLGRRATMVKLSDTDFPAPAGPSIVPAA